MGEVYKADDLELNQTVALKFLPESFSKNESALTRFRGEVRNARQVSHKNVCRVFDIGEMDSIYYLSMEYVDGDDLSMLLRRIGRLPADKAVEISRQICLGLHAIHDAKILHRDLKPANVIIDSHGKARITDFGIAGIEQDIQTKKEIVGTPAYMSPEQITGKEVTAKSDIYSLGLLLYEIFTGKQAVKGDSINELIEIHQSQTPTNPSEFVENIDPLVEKIINRCLEKQPEDRPRSALQVALALPGGNPLEAAIAAGETPSPEMIAAVPKKGALRPQIALTLLLLVIASFGLVAVLHQYYKIYNVVPLEKSPEILAERAKTIAQNLGYSDTPADIKYRFDIDNSFIQYAKENESIKNVREYLRAGQPLHIYFIYRQSPRPLEPWYSILVFGDDPPLTVSGMTNVYLDTRGRLIKFIAVPDQGIGTAKEDQTDWKRLFDEAGLEISKFRQTESERIPPVFADEKTAWEGTLADFNDIPIRIEAAAYNGKPVYFEVVNPWDKPIRQQQRNTTGSKIGDLVFFTIFILVLVSAVLLARHNIKNGRGDLKGGFKLMVFCFLSLSLMGLIFADHVWSINGQMTIFGRILGDGLYYSMLIGLIYIALEPYARRYWSELLISWNRLLAGDFRDPMIGRDILIGGFAGVGVTLISIYCGNFLSLYLFGAGLNVSENFFNHPLNGWSGTLGHLFGATIFPVLLGLIPLFLLVLFFVIFKNKKVSIVLILLLLSILNVPQLLNEHWIYLITFFIGNLILVFVLIRFGLLAVIFVLVYQALSHNFLLAFDTSSHLFPGTIIVFIVAFGLAIYGFYTSTAGKSIFGSGFLDEAKE
ncbi:MAG: serine/threonine-protein kinase [Aridibacter sp.]